jgi:hypothetical protein
MNIKPIRTKPNYRAALADIESLMAAKANSRKGIAWMSWQRWSRPMSAPTFRWICPMR